MDSLAPHQLRSPASRRSSSSSASAAERVLHAELKGSPQDNDALSMMVSSMVHMVQAGNGSDSRWSAS